MIDTNDLGRLSGLPVTGSDGEAIGKIADVYESTDGGGGTFATVTTGLFGGGSSFFPLDDAELRGDEVVVPYTKDVVKDAPRVENDEELTAPEEQRLYEHYRGSGARAAGTTTGTGTTGREAVGHDTSGPTTDDAMTRSEERLQVGTEQVETGRARLRKYVVTENVTRTVPVSREEVRIEREPITDANRGEAMSGPDLSEEEHEVVLRAERPVVEKETVPVERVRLDKETVTEQQEVSEQVSKEQIEMAGDDAGRSTRGADVYPEETTRATSDMDVEPRR
ncbi:MAG: photosystem reaction center subunit [Frankiales bacterium]|jgi:uncharacterized protein (TIGR02271 family)|nr:photosystem reaction center subunit [Frankiales bacterium]